MSKTTKPQPICPKIISLNIFEYVNVSSSFLVIVYLNPSLATHTWTTEHVILIIYIITYIFQSRKVKKNLHMHVHQMIKMIIIAIKTSYDDIRVDSGNYAHWIARRDVILTKIFTASIISYQIHTIIFDDLSCAW